MRHYLDIARRLKLEIVRKGLFKTSFVTSLNIIKEVMGVPLAAVQAIARGACLYVDDPQSECIDENSLGVFADAYVRRMKSYFFRCVHASQLDPDDLCAFIQFQLTFKKSTVSNVEKWSDIDTDALRESFLAQVKELTPKCKTPLEVLEELFYTSVHLDFDIKEPVSGENILYSFQQAQRIVARAKASRRVLQSHMFLAKPQVKKPLCPSRRRDKARAILIPAHYHIYSNDDDDHHDMDTVNN